MPENTTTNYGLPYPSNTGLVHNGPADFEELAKKIDETFSSYSEGTAAARPAAKIKGRVYFATDTKVYSVDTGSAWKELVESETITDAKIAKGAITSDKLASATTSWVNKAAESPVGFVKEYEHEFSATRETEVMVGVTTNAPPQTVAVSVGGVRVLWPDGSSAPDMTETFFSLRIPAGQKIKFTSVGEFKVSIAARTI